MNPLNMLRQYLMQGLTPQNILSKLNINNPLLNDIINMARNGDANGVETFARNVCKQRGINFDTAYSKFRSSIK